MNEIYRHKDASGQTFIAYEYNGIIKLRTLNMDAKIEPDRLFSTLAWAKSYIAKEVK
jgi:ribonuclease PH